MRALRSLAGFTVLSSMSRAKESNFWPSAVRRSMAALLRLRSLSRFLKPGRYHATTYMSRAWQAWMNSSSASGLATGRYSVVDDGLW